MTYSSLRINSTVLRNYKSCCYPLKNCLARFKVYFSLEIILLILMILFRHNNEVYHIRIYTQEVDGAMKHYLVDSLLFDSLQVRQKINLKISIEIL